MEFGFHIADFTWDGGPSEIGPALTRLAQDAEAGGIARLTVMNHFRQIAPIELLAGVAGEAAGW